MQVREFKSKVREAAETDKYALRDSDGFIYWVDSVDMDTIYYHSGDETHRASWDQLHDQYSLVDSADLDLLR